VFDLKGCTTLKIGKPSGQLQVAKQSRLKEIQTLVLPVLIPGLKIVFALAGNTDPLDLGSVARGTRVPLLIPDPVENRTLGPAGSGISQRAAAARTQRLWRWLVVTGRKPQASSHKLQA